jgi:hypothetical protein
MPDIKPDQRIYDVVRDIDTGVYWIPNIQRGYEWGIDRVTKLLDSIMSGYPIGAIMAWKPDDATRQEIRTRRFTRDFSSIGEYPSDTPDPSGDQAYLILDGQQRLQSLYISFLGSYDGKRAYLRVDYIPTDDGDDTDYDFEFLTNEEAQARLQMVHLRTLIKLDMQRLFPFINNLATQLCASINDPLEHAQAFSQKQQDIATNTNRFRECFNVKESLLFQEVEEWHSYEHVLEIFERVNSAGMVLDKSDLLFSTIKLKLAKMEDSFTATLRFLNQDNRYAFTTDFLIKVCLVVFGQRARYEVAKLKNDKFIDDLKRDYSRLDKCFRQMSVWLDDVAHIKANRFLRSQNALIPIIDYMMLSGNDNKPDGENGRAMTQYLYMSFFSRLFSRASDSVLDQIHTVLVREISVNKDHFPIEAIRASMMARLNINYQLEDRYLGNDPDLLLNIVDGGVLQRDPKDPLLGPKDLKLEVDHIFPRSRLKGLGLGDVADHIGNYRLLVMLANRHKSDNPPDLVLQRRIKLHMISPPVQVQAA